MVLQVVCGIDVDAGHPPGVGWVHEWFAACLIQKVVRGKVHRTRVAKRLVRVSTCCGAEGERGVRRGAGAQSPSPCAPACLFH